MTNHVLIVFAAMFVTCMALPAIKDADVPSVGALSDNADALESASVIITADQHPADTDEDVSALSDVEIRPDQRPVDTRLLQTREKWGHWHHRHHRHHWHHRHHRHHWHHRHHRHHRHHAHRTPRPTLSPDTTPVPRISTRAPTAWPRTGFTTRSPVRAPCVSEITVVVGPSAGSRTKSVHSPSYSGISCPSRIDRSNWLGGHRYSDWFDVSVSGTYVIVKRGDRQSSWGMNLEFKCCSGASASTAPPTSHGATGATAVASLPTTTTGAPFAGIVRDTCTSIPFMPCSRCSCPAGYQKDVCENNYFKDVLVCIPPGTRSPDTSTRAPAFTSKLTAPPTRKPTRAPMRPTVGGEDCYWSSCGLGNQCSDGYTEMDATCDGCGCVWGVGPRKEKCCKTVPWGTWPHRKEALPNQPGWTEFSGTTKGPSVASFSTVGLDWKVGNIVPRSCDANLGFKAWSESGVPKIQLTVTDHNTKLTNHQNVKHAIETARLVDVSLDYFIKGNSWLSGKFLDYHGTTDIVIELKVDATISYDTRTRKWRLEKDALVFKPGGNIDFQTNSWLFNTFVNSALDAVLSDFVTITMVDVVKRWIPEQMSFGLPPAVRSMIENHFAGEAAGTVLAVNGEAMWFLPVHDYVGREELLQLGDSSQHEWAWLKGVLAPRTPVPMFGQSMFRPNPLALPIFYKDLDSKGNDYEVSNIVVHVANFQLTAQLVEIGGKPNIRIGLGAACHSSGSRIAAIANYAACRTRPARLEIDVDYYFNTLSFPWFRDQGTAKIELDLGFDATLAMNDDGSWRLNENEHIDLHVDGEMRMENSKWAWIVNPLLKLFLNDELEKLLASYVKKHFLPTIPTYFPKHYMMLLEDIIRASAKNNVKFAVDIDLNVPRKQETLYLQDRLQQRLDALSDVELRELEQKHVQDGHNRANNQHVDSLAAVIGSTLESRHDL